MPVPPEQLDAIAATVAAVYREAETALVAEIARHLAGDLDGIEQAPAWAERKLAAVRALRRSASAILAGLQADSSTALREAAATAFRSGWSSALAELPEQWFPRSQLGDQAQKAAGELPGFAAVEALANAVHADIGRRSANVLRDALDSYRAVITAATGRTVTGTHTRRQAAQAAWRTLVDRGITSFVDRSGRRWKLSSYVEMATRTVTQRAAVQGQTDRLDTLGVHLVYASNAPQECVLCRPYEGRVLRTNPGPTGEITAEHQITGKPVTVDVVATLDHARAAGFLHPNCRHSVSAYLPGITRVPAQPTADPAGDRARQRQREIERQIRKHKVRQTAALNEVERTAAGRKVRAWQTEMRDHLAAHPELKRLPYREQIGAGNHPTRSTTPAGDIGAPADEPLFGGAPVPSGNRARQHQDHAEPEQPAVVDDADQLDLLDQPDPVPDFSALDDDELADALAAHADNDEAVAAILAELDRRQDEADAAEQAAEARRQQQRDRRETQRRERQEQQMATYDRLVSEGVPDEEAWAEATGQSVEAQRREDAIYRLREQGYTGRGFDELARAAFREYTEAQFLAAEADTNGYLLSNAGEAAGVDPRELFAGPAARARKWASDELLEWWDDHGRVGFDEFAAQLLGDQKAARDHGFRTGGEDWLR